MWSHIEIPFNIAYSVKTNGCCYHCLKKGKGKLLKYLSCNNSIAQNYSVGYEKIYLMYIYHISSIVYWCWISSLFLGQILAFEEFESPSTQDLSGVA